MTIREAAALLGVSYASCWRLVRTGKLGAWRPTSRFVVEPADVANFRTACRYRAKRTRVALPTPQPTVAQCRSYTRDLVERARREVLADMRTVGSDH